MKRRSIAVLLALVVGLSVAGCARRDDAGGQDRHGGFYGGVSIGRSPGGGEGGGGHGM